MLVPHFHTRLFFSNTKAPIPSKEQEPASLFISILLLALPRSFQSAMISDLCTLYSAFRHQALLLHHQMFDLPAVPPVRSVRPSCRYIHILHNFGSFCSVFSPFTSTGFANSSVISLFISLPLSASSSNQNSTPLS